MSIKWRIKKVVNSVEPNNEILMKVKTACGIPSVRAKVKKPFYSSILFKTLTPVMACLVLAITCVSVVFALPKKMSNSSYVLLDMGSLVQLKMQDEVVVEHTALNQPAQVLLLGCDYKEQSIEIAVTDIIDNAEELGIIEKGDHINISTIVKKKNNQLMKSNLYKEMNNLHETLGDEYIIESTYTSQKELLTKIADKYACEVSTIDDKDIGELLKIYVNHNNKEATDFDLQINAQLDTLWEENLESLNNDFKYIMYKAVCEKMEIIVENIKLLQENHNENMYQGVSDLIDYIYINFSIMLEDFEINDEFVAYVSNYLAEMQAKLQAIEDEYIAKFEEQSLEYKKQLILNLMQGNYSVNSMVS